MMVTSSNGDSGAYKFTTECALCGASTSGDSFFELDDWGMEHEDICEGSGDTPVAEKLAQLIARTTI